MSTASKNTVTSNNRGILYIYHNCWQNSPYSDWKWIPMPLFEIISDLIKCVSNVLAYFTCRKHQSKCRTSKDKWTSIRHLDQSHHVTVNEKQMMDVILERIKQINKWTLNYFVLNHEHHSTYDNDVARKTNQKEISIHIWKIIDPPKSAIYLLVDTFSRARIDCRNWK